jgi:hypothetical protein
MTPTTDAALEAAARLDRAETDRQVLAACQRQLDELRTEGGVFAWSVDDYRAAANAAALTFVQEGAAVAFVEPGNMTRYSIICTALPEDAQAWLGGQLLISLPENGDRRAFVVSLPTYLTWQTVAEHAGLRYADAVHVAVFVTCFAQAVQMLETL